MSRRRILAIVTLSLVATAVVLWLVIHSRGVQRSLTERAIAAIEEQTGWRVEVGEARFRVWPARLVVEHLTVSAGDRQVASVERIEASWRWRRLLGTPRRLESIALRGVAVDLRGLELPEVEAATGEAPADPWRAIEVQRLVLERGTIDAGGLDVELALDGIRVEGSMIDGSARAAFDAERLVLLRDERELDLGRLALRGSASAAGVVVERLSADGPEVALAVSGEIDLASPVSGRANFTARSNIAAALGWWDPNLASGLELDGVLDLEGGAALDPASGFRATAVHRGDPIRVVGYELHEVEVGVDGGIPTVRLAGPSWGEASITPVEDATARIVARFDDAPVGPVLDLVALPATRALGRPIRVSGTVDGTAGFPVVLDTLAGTADIVVRTPDGRLEVAARGAGDTWTVERLAVDATWARVDGNGGIGPDGGLRADLELAVSDVARLRELAGAWIELPDELTLGGGPITGDATLSGTLADPQYTGRLAWQRPVVAGRELEGFAAEAQGDRAFGEWELEFRAAPSSLATANGSLELAGPRVDGRWRFELEDPAELVELAQLQLGAVPLLGGRLEGDGGFEWSAEMWSVHGRVAARSLVVDDWTVETLDVEFEVGPEAAVVRSLSAELLGGRLEGTAEIGMSGLEAPVAAVVDWQNLDLGHVPVELPTGALGSVSGNLSLTGTVGGPAGEFEVTWTPDDAASPVPSIVVAGALDDGVARLTSREVETYAGIAMARATVPMGALPLPDWLWPDAPDGPVRLVADGHDLRSEPLVALLGVEPLPVSASAELTLDAAWHPGRTRETSVFAELNGLRVRYPGGEMQAQGPIELRIDDQRLRLEPAVLTGPQTRIEVAGEGDLRSGRIDGRLEAVIAPQIARLIPYPVQIYEPIRIAASATGSLGAPRAAITVEHPGGALVLRDPPLFIRDLWFSAEVVDGRIWINDGRAAVNQGRVELGGGWDPESGQGVVAELENVVVFVEGILSQWSGTLAVEPERDRLARVSGELNLVAGLWDQDVAIGGMLFGGASLDPAGDDPLQDVALDLDVRGRGVVRVENNLGRFDARWDVLRVSGNLMRPRIQGEIKIAPGGRLALAGQRVTVRRGNVVFTGDPGVDPIVEIVPESDVAVFGSGEGQVDATSVATQSLVGGLAGALGFENETLQPAEISVEVEKDSSEQLMLGQRLSHNIALFFASNTRDVQDRTSMLQLWNIPGLKGLALQGYQKTLTDEAGGNLIQRFQWGGSSLYEDRPTIRKLTLEGDWPISKRRLKKATGFRRGQPYDPFLTFVAKVRMERELAGSGFQEASVSPRVVEKNNAWTMIFECEPGPRQEVVFAGHDPPRRIRQEVTALYQPPPLEGVGFRNMQSLLDRYYDAEGFPDTKIAVERRDTAVVATIHRGEDVELTGPVLVGAPDEVADAVRERLGSPTELALLPADEERAKRVVGRVLADLGYTDAEVASVDKVATGDGRVEIRIEADLGAPALVDELVVIGDDPLGLTRSDDFRLREGSRIDRAAVDLTASQLRAAYDAAGYSDAEISGGLTELPDAGWRVTFQIDPGRRRTVGDIEITGLKHTSEKVLRSGVSVDEGEILRNPDLDTTAVRIANFAPIERVDVRTVPQGTDRARVELEVAEKPRWTSEVGGGWSTERGAQVRFGLRDDNLLGRGLSLNLRGRWDRTEWLGFLVASLPPPPGRRFSFTTTGGFSRGEAPGDPNLDQDEAFWSFEVTRWLGRGDLAIGTAGEQITGYYRFTRTRSYGILDTGFFPIEIDITVDTSLIGARYVHDRFDSPFDPTSGYGVVIDAGYADDLIGSELSYWTTLASGSMAKGAPFESTWIQSLRLGVTEPLDDQNLIRSVKFFAGGQGSIRGFDRDSVGPVVPSGDGYDPAGGGALFILNEELRIPIKGGFRAAVFADVGQVWTSWSEADWDLAVGAGVGIRWATPVGPLWADVAWPVVNPDISPPGSPPYLYPIRPMSSSKPKFYFGIGRPF